MTKIELQTEQFKKFVQAITTITTESFLNLDETGMWVRAVDSPNYAMITATIKRDKIEKYGFKKDAKPVKVAMNWSTISRISKSIDYQSVIELDFKEKELDFVGGDFHVISPYPEIDTVIKEPNAVKLNSSTSFEFNGDKLHQIRGLNASERFKLVAKPTLVELEGTGENDDTIAINLTNEYKGEPATALYGTDYLTAFGKVFVGSSVTVKFKTDHPISLSTNSHGVDIEYLLAPRIESKPEIEEN